jgi:hypothetical protein
MQRLRMYSAPTIIGAYLFCVWVNVGASVFGAFDELHGLLRFTQIHGGIQELKKEIQELKSKMEETSSETVSVSEDTSAAHMEAIIT